MKRVIAALVSAAGLTTGMWFVHSPQLGQYCIPTAAGLYTKMFVTASGIDNPVVPLIIEEEQSDGSIKKVPSLGQRKACGAVEAHAKPSEA